jgi:nucleotide-binding universal stress UspA family protein
MKKILVPFDFSGTSTNAMHHAFRIAQQTEAELTLLLCHPIGRPTQQPGPPFLSLSNQLADVLRSMGMNERPARVNYRIGELQEGQSVEEVIKRNPYDLWVVGTGKGEASTSSCFRRLINALAASLTTPVLFVPERAHPQSIGAISLMIHSVERRYKRGLSLLFDLTAALGAHLQINCAGTGGAERFSFRKALTPLGLTARLDSIRHTYHCVPPGLLEALERNVHPDESQWLVRFRSAAQPVTAEHQRIHCQVPLLMLPCQEEVTYPIPVSSEARERRLLAGMY